MATLLPVVRTAVTGAMLGFTIVLVSSPFSPSGKPDEFGFKWFTGLGALTGTIVGLVVVGNSRRDDLLPSLKKRGAMCHAPLFVYGTTPATSARLHESFPETIALY